MTAPIYRAPDCELWHGDALSLVDEMPETIDCVLMDPPYCSGARTEAAKGTAEKSKMLRGSRWNAKPLANDQMTATGYVWLMREILLALRPRLSEGASVLIFTDWRMWPNLAGAVETADLRVQGMVVWDKESMGLGHGFRAQHELILHASHRSPTIHDAGFGNVLRCKRDRVSNHPTPKPLDLLMRLLSCVTGPGSMVVDPFAGNASTLAAARHLDRLSWGCELSAEYAAQGAARLRGEGCALSHDPSQTDLFGDGAVTFKRE